MFQEAKKDNLKLPNKQQAGWHCTFFRGGEVGGDAEDDGFTFQLAEFLRK